MKALRRAIPAAADQHAESRHDQAGEQYQPAAAGCGELRVDSAATAAVMAGAARFISFGDDGGAACRNHQHAVAFAHHLVIEVDADDRVGTQLGGALGQFLHGDVAGAL